ncbi:ABC-type branched-subunit amino acid transport system ATPase component [Bradyrhizobium sp. LM2.7]
MLEVSGLVKRFGGFTAVNNVSFRVDQGEILGLIGPNGSGKSTIFNMLSGTLAPTSGSILFAGHEIAGLAPHRIINRGIGRTFQIPRPFPPPDHLRERRARRILRSGAPQPRQSRGGRRAVAGDRGLAGGSPCQC